MKYKKYKPQKYSTELYTTSDLYKQQLISPQGQQILAVLLFAMHGERQGQNLQNVSRNCRYPDSRTFRLRHLTDDSPMTSVGVL